MPKLNINISLSVSISYYEKKTDMTDKEINDKVYGLVEPERNKLAAEVRVAAIKLLNGEDLE